ncbi:MAG: 3'-5' exonuclease [Pseudomonadota bacterium]
MRRVRFTLTPGYVRSRFDGDRHYVGVLQLERAYRLHRDEYDVLLPDDESWRRRAQEREGLIALGPREDGQYALAKLSAVQDDLRKRLDRLSAELDAAPRRRRPRRRWAVMVDLETMGTAPGSAIVSIGAIAFDPVAGRFGPCLYVPIDLTSNLAAGLTEDPVTRAWWARQSAAARAVLTDPERVALPDALAELDAYWREVCGQEFWAHGPNFDETLLTAAYRAVGRRPPWAFWNTRCTRTIYAAAGVTPDRAKGVHHNALQDAMNQAEAVVEAYRVLRLGRRPLRWILARLWRRILRGRR